MIGVVYVVKHCGVRSDRATFNKVCTWVYCAL